MKAGTLATPPAGVLLTVGIGDLVVTADRGSALVSYGLGSGIAVCLWDPARPVAGMAHIMLPAAPPGSTSPGTPARFADRAIDGLLDALARLNVDRTRLVAKIAGGAQMFGGPGQVDALAIGQRNAERVRALLRAQQLPLVAEDTGGHAGRTVTFFTASGTMRVKTIGGGEREF